MKPVTRRGFLQVAGAAALGATAFSVLTPKLARSDRKRRQVRLQPVPATSFHPADEAFCKRARFPTAADAVRVAARRGLSAEIYREDLFS
ncbi:MAG: twin-arginine translocation signal domain-containing protein [Verrucomicrobia bacterium]|nr:twin-arginine translocation signal domain-containing protein [Verrucomicrobiota bacterium]